MTAGLTKNLGLKLLALGIAVVLWVLVSGEEESVRVFSVPLQLRVAADRILVTDPPDSVKVRLRGSESLLRSLAAEDLAVPVDLREAAPGQRQRPTLMPESVQGVPVGVTVETITPDHLALTVEARAARTVPVSPRLEGTPPPGFRLIGYDVSPDRVLLEGPETDIAKVATAVTEPIYLHDRESGFSVEASLSVARPRVKVLTPSVAVRIHIDRVEEADR